MITMLRWRVAHNIWVATLKVKAHNFVIWSRILQLLLTNYFSVSNTYSGSITRFWPALVSKSHGSFGASDNMKQKQWQNKHVA